MSDSHELLKSLLDFAQRAMGDSGTRDKSQIALSVLSIMNKVVERSDDGIPTNALSSMIGARAASPSDCAVDEPRPRTTNEKSRKQK
ncbi:hypothetical protein BGZ65_001066, partial [Modicella reniformis]